jgi:hypothetical protein
MSVLELYALGSPDTQSGVAARSEKLTGQTLNFPSWEGTMRKLIVAGTAAPLLLAGAAQAQPVSYTWVGPGDMAGWVNPMAGDGPPHDG